MGAPLPSTIHCQRLGNPPAGCDPTAGGGKAAELLQLSLPAQADAQCPLSMLSRAAAGSHGQGRVRCLQEYPDSAGGAQVWLGLYVLCGEVALAEVGRWPRL